MEAASAAEIRKANSESQRSAAIEQSSERLRRSKRIAKKRKEKNIESRNKTREALESSKHKSSQIKNLISIKKNYAKDNRLKVSDLLNKKK